MKNIVLIITIAFLTLFKGQVSAQTQVNWFTFSKDYYPGTYDANNKYLGGTDLMYLANYKGKLWAGTSVWNDNPSSDPTPGPQILYKETSSSNWKVDTSLGTGYLRTDAFYSFIFTEDKFGNPLPQPDLYDRKVIGWSQSPDMTAKNTAVKAWQMAVTNRPPSEKLIFHSDRGIQYACSEFANLLDSYSCVERSMSRKGNYWDHALTESFFKTLKVEFIYQNRFSTYQEASLAIFEWIETWYNRNRRHSALDNLTISEFEKRTALKCVA